MRKRLLFTLLFTFFSIIGLLAQSKQWNTAQKKKYWDAESYFIHGDYKMAMQEFNALEGIDSSFLALEFKIGYSYFHLRKFDEAKMYFDKSKTFNADAYYFLAKIALYKEELKEAKSYIESYEKFKNENTQIEDGYALILQNKITTAEILMQDYEEVNIINLGPNINTAFDEYVPLVDASENQLVYTSRRLKEGNELDPLGRPFEDVYYSKRNDEGNDWIEAKSIESVNTSLNDACVGYSANGEILYLFKTNKNLITGDLYESLWIDDKWTTPVALTEKVNNQNSIERSVSISLDGNTLYFSSNRPNGFGGFDLYRIVKLPTGEWSDPINLGARINTSGDEDSPFIHPNGSRLYFSSTRHENMGGYDIFYSDKKDNEWSRPINLGYPTNTTKDDIHFSISANEQHGYYAATRAEGFGGKDIYLIDYLEKELRQSVIQAHVMDSASQKGISADISTLEIEYGEISGTYISNSRSGKFIFLVNPEVEYEILIEADGYESKTEILKYSVDDLMQSQHMEFNLKRLGSE